MTLKPLRHARQVLPGGPTWVTAIATYEEWQARGVGEGGGGGGQAGGAPPGRGRLAIRTEKCTGLRNEGREGLVHAYARMRTVSFTLICVCVNESERGRCAHWRCDLAIRYSETSAKPGTLLSGGSR